MLQKLHLLTLGEVILFVVIFFKRNSFYVKKIYIFNPKHVIVILMLYNTITHTHIFCNDYYITIY